MLRRTPSPFVRSPGNGSPWSWAAILSLLLFVPAPAWADPPAGATRVEEDWELAVVQPDPTLTAPQVTCTISPRPDLEHRHATFELNYQSYPYFESGGLSLHVWDAEEALVTKKVGPHIALDTPDETITWTTSMSYVDGYLVFRVKRGMSTTWGQFGRYGELRHYVVADVPDLAGYSPDVSVANSGIGFAGNRVERLVLKEVRWYGPEGLLHTDSTLRVVHQK